MIDRKLILANAPSNINEQIHVNHKGCTAGVDTKKRLYVKRTYKGLVAYCQHCSQSGFASDDDNTERLSSWIQGKQSPMVLNVMPKLTSVSMDGSIWLHKHYCNVDDSNFNGIVDDPKKMALTLHNPSYDVIGYQVRNLVPDAVPKYLTYYNFLGNRGDSSWFHLNSKTLVICEDYLSAYRVFRDTGHSSVALLRTTISDRTLTQIAELEFNTIFIWLDPDEAGVSGATKAYKKLNHYLPQGTTIAFLGINKEPKECTKIELCSILT